MATTKITLNELRTLIKKIINEEININKINDITVDEYILAKKEADFEISDTVKILIKKLFPEVEDFILNRIINDIDEDKIISDINNLLHPLAAKFPIPNDERKKEQQKIETDYFKNYIKNFVKNNRLV